MKHTFEISREELNVEWSVVCGQTFRWTYSDTNGWHTTLFDSVSHQNVFLGIRQTDDRLLVTSNSITCIDLLRSYFRLDTTLAEAYDLFGGSRTPLLSHAFQKFSGLRVLRQDPVECLFSFICTSAAPLHRIRKSVMGICELYGETVPGSPTAIYAFPTVERLAAASDPDLRMVGLGYRAKFIVQAAREINQRGGEPWLRSLRTVTYSDAKRALMELTGVGDKIADCVCLFALDKDEAVPVDTHVRRLVVRDYAVAIDGSRSIPSNADIATAFRAVHTNMAGWAQQYLFFAELYERGSWGSYVKLCSQ